MEITPSQRQKAEVQAASIIDNRRNLSQLLTRIQEIKSILAIKSDPKLEEELKTLAARLAQMKKEDKTINTDPEVRNVLLEVAEQEYRK